jgi:hypothetical protein
MPPEKSLSGWPAMSHGLTSRTMREAEAPEVERLAHALIRGSPPEPEILGAARETAEAILHLRRIKTMRAHLMKELMVAPPASAKVPSAAAIRAMGVILRDGITPANSRLVARFGEEMGLGAGSPRLSEITSEEEATERLLRIYRDLPDALRRLDDYERKALSRRASLLRRLDFRRVEAERLRQAEQASTSRKTRPPG